MNPESKIISYEIEQLDQKLAKVSDWSILLFFVPFVVIMLLGISFAVELFCCILHNDIELPVEERIKPGIVWYVIKTFIPWVFVIWMFMFFGTIFKLKFIQDKLIYAKKENLDYVFGSDEYLYEEIEIK